MSKDRLVVGFALVTVLGLAACGAGLGAGAVWGRGQG